MSDDQETSLEAVEQGVFLHGNVTELPQAVTVIDTDLDDLKFVVSAIPGPDGGLQVEEIDWHPQAVERIGPDRATGERWVVAVESFLAEIQRRPLIEDRSAVWVNRPINTVTAVYDDHPGGRGADTVDAARRGGRREDRLSLKLTPDRDWKAWADLSGKYYDQETFGDHIEELLHTVQEPTQATLLDVIDNIRVSSEGNFGSTVDRTSGSVNFTYQDVKKGTAGNLEIPKTLLLRSRVWDGYPVEFDYQAWFRYTLSEGTLRLGVKLKPRRRVEEAAWVELLDEIRHALNPDAATGADETFPVLLEG